MASEVNPQTYSPLDRPGIFKGRIIGCQVEDGSTKPEPTKTVSVSIKFEVTAQLEGQEWKDWSEYGPYSVIGWYHVIGKDGGVNQKTVDQLVKSFGWNGDLSAFLGDAPDVLGKVVQFTVEENNYNGKTSYRAGWMNPEDYAPQSRALDADSVKKLNTQAGSLLRAAAAAAKAGSPASTAPKTKAPPAPSAKEPASKPAAAKGKKSDTKAPRDAGSYASADDIPF